MKTQLIAIFILVSGICYGQSVVETDTTRLSKERKEQLLNNYKLNSGDHPLDKNSSPDNKPEKTEYSFDENVKTSDMNISVPQYYEGPLYNYTAGPNINPYVNDYSFYGRHLVMDRGWINTASSHTTFPAFGSLTLIKANYEYLLSDHIIASVGTYGARYFYNLSTFYDFGINASLEYKITDRFSLIGFGQYSARSNINNIGGDNAWMLPQTNYGVAAQYMFTNHLGLEGGVKRELNPMNGKWRNIPFINPVIRIK